MKSKSIRAFIGAKDFSLSRNFYNDMGFEEVILGGHMSLFKVNEHLSFYLQNAYVKDWVDNTMLFLELEDLDNCEQELKAKELDKKYPTVRFSNIKNENWGRELFMHDPSGILWHFGEFK
tara:strand:- start:286 stop:645 length:360 start_codon:yes stop_codon:yes gene_type:complete